MRAPVTATAADLVTFLAMLAIVGAGAETNPLVRAAIASGLLGGVLAAKVALLVVFAAWNRAVGRLARPVWLAGVAIGVAGAASNVRAVLA